MTKPEQDRPRGKAARRAARKASHVSLTWNKDHAGTSRKPNKSDQGRGHRKEKDLQNGYSVRRRLRH